ncbi:MAG: response regulator transcription factor [Bacteroidota bacterium]
MPSISSIHVLLIENDFQDCFLLKNLLKSVGVRKILVVNLHDSDSVFDQFNYDLIIMGVDAKNVEKNVAFATRLLSVRWKPLIVLSEDFNEQLFEKIKSLHPYSFMSKDLSILKIKQAIELAIVQNSLSQGTSSEEVQQEKDDIIFAQVGNIVKKIKLADIWWIQSEGKYTAIKAASGRVLMDMSLRNLAKKLRQKGFVRTHKSYIVNLKHVEYADKSGSTVFIKGENIPVGRSFKSNFFRMVKKI